MLLFHASAFSSHYSYLCSFPSSHTSLYTLLWMHFYFCSLLERLCPNILAWFFSSLLSDLCSNMLFSERSLPKSHWNSPTEIVQTCHSLSIFHHFIFFRARITPDILYTYFFIASLYPLDFKSWREGQDISHGLAHVPNTYSGAWCLADTQK